MSNKYFLFFCLSLILVLGSQARARTEANPINFDKMISIATDSKGVELKVRCLINDQGVERVRVNKFEGLFEMLEGNEMNLYVNPYTITVYKTGPQILNGLFPVNVVPSLVDGIVISRTKDYEMTLYKRGISQYLAEYVVSVKTSMGTYEKFVTCEETF